MNSEREAGYMIPVERIEGAIFEVRGQKVMLDVDLANLYGVETGALVRAVKRNLDRFPADFQFRLTPGEFDSLRCQIGISKGRGGRRYLPYVFTEHGAVMLASILKTKRAAEVSVFVVRAFIRMRRLLAGQRELALKLAELESKLTVHDENFKAVFDAIRKLMQKPEPYPKPPRQIGFHVSDRPARHFAGPRPKKT